ncbi:MAG: hypothetical protein SWK76_17090 [Actinomycetota bacterium]|nr:hypothetical protein [Actinomycetota bacterium]
MMMWIMIALASLITLLAAYGLLRPFIKRWVNERSAKKEAERVEQSLSDFDKAVKDTVDDLVEVGSAIADALLPVFEEVVDSLILITKALMPVIDEISESMRQDEPEQEPPAPLQVVKHTGGFVSLPRTSGKSALIEELVGQSNEAGPVQEQTESEDKPHEMQIVKLAKEQCRMWRRLRHGR